MIYIFGALRGLLCENPKCNWIDKDIPVKAFKFWVNKGCPKCASKVLTREEFNDYNEKYPIRYDIPSKQGRKPKQKDDDDI